MRRTLTLALAALALALRGAPAAAQDPFPPEESLPAEVAERVVEFYNAPGTVRFQGPTDIEAGRTVAGDVAVLRGPLVLAGRVDGRLLVINGDLELRPGASVTGGITVVGGAVRGAEGASTGGVEVHEAPLEYTRTGDRIAWMGEHDGEVVWSEDEGPRRGRADFVVATGNPYNRVEGLPITLGPVFETEGSNPLRLRAMGIFRTEDGPSLGPERWGYDARLEQFLGGHRAFRVGVGVHSVVDAIEDWHLSKLESSLSTFFLRRDYRDHYEREGWRAYAQLTPPGSPVSATLTWVDERHRTLPAGSPWSLFRNDEPWRAQPLAAEGVFRSLSVDVEVDTRSHSFDPSNGWFASARLERSVDARLETRDLETQPPVSAVLPGQTFGDFTTGYVDIRRYNRISPTSRLNLRLLAGGALTGGALPPQRQHALGGEGTLPGYGLFSLACGARHEGYRPGELNNPERNLDEPITAFTTGYGCDRFVLGQVEYRGNLSFRVNLGDWGGDGDEEEDGEYEEDGWSRASYSDWQADFGWVLFADAGRGWSRGSLRGEQSQVDVGAGVLLGRVGIYGAVPLEGGDGVSFFVRLVPRF